MKIGAASLFVFILMFISLKAQAVRSVGGVITPEDIQKYGGGFQLTIQEEGPPSTDLKIEVSGEDSDVADLSNDIFVCTSKEHIKTKKILKKAKNVFALNVQRECASPLPSIHFSDSPTGVRRTVDSKRK